MQEDVYLFTSMNRYQYYILTIGLYCIEIVGGVFITDLGSLFDYVGAIANASLTFILPGFFYVLAEKKCGTQFYPDQGKLMRFSAYAYIVLGFATFTFLVTGNILK